MKRFNNLLLPILAAIGFLVMSSVFVVDEREKALRLWFGEVTAVIADPGLNFKVPFLHEVVKYEDRILPLDVQPDEFTPLDDRRLVVDGFALWRFKILYSLEELLDQVDRDQQRKNLMVL